MKIKLITTDVTTSGRGVGFKFLGILKLKKDQLFLELQ